MNIQEVELREQIGEKYDVSPVMIPSEPFSLLDTTLFWSRQITQHALFLHLSLIPTELAKYGQLELKDQFLFLYQQGMSLLINKASMEQILVWLNAVRDAKLKYIQLSTLHWVGYSSISEQEHYLMELEYLLYKIQQKTKGEPTDVDYEMKFWGDVNGDHIGLDARLLDPLEVKLFKMSLDFEQLFKSFEANQPSLETLIAASEKSNDLLNFISKGVVDRSILSIISPQVAYHQLREGLRSILALRYIEQGLDV